MPGKLELALLNVVQFMKIRFHGLLSIKGVLKVFAAS